MNTIVSYSTLPVSKLTDIQTQLLVFGSTLNIFLNVMANIGVTIVAIPPTGVTLPFISAGGTSMLVNSLSLGLILGLTSKRMWT
jgi:cell division protein FtsW